MSIQTIARSEVILVNGDYKDTLSIAEQENKKILLVFTRQDCSWCELQKNILEDHEILNYLENYILFYVDSSKSKELAKKYNIKSIPVIFIIDDKEKVYKKNIGYLNKENLIKYLQ